MDRPPDPPPKVEASSSPAQGSASNLPPRADGGSSNARRRRNKRGGGNKNLAGGGRNKNRSKRGGGGGGGGALQLPQLKITIRNIGDVERFGTAAQVLDMVRALLDSVKAEDAGMPIRLEEESVQRIIRTEELVAAAVAEATEKAAAAENGQEEVNIENANEDGNNEEEKTEMKDADKMEEAKNEAQTKEGLQKEAQSSGPAYAAVASSTVNADGDSKQDTVEAISARVVYVVPPKRSRRRGVNNGCAYLVLSTPPLSKTPEQLESIMSPSDRSRAVAKARLELLQALDAISVKARADARASQLYAGCMVEQSLNVKTWKERERSHRDRREGTIEQTGDYKRFMSNMEKAEQERLQRPKPAPGGGAVTAEATDESGQPVAALVLHLRAKKEEQRARRKRASAKKKQADKDNKAPPPRKKKPAAAPSNKPAKSNNRRDNKSRKKRSKKGAAAANPSVTPTLLKHGNSAQGKAGPVGMVNGKG